MNLNVARVSKKDGRFELSHKRGKGRYLKYAVGLVKNKGIDLLIL